MVQKIDRAFLDISASSDGKKAKKVTQYASLKSVRLQNLPLNTNISNLWGHKKSEEIKSI